MIDFGRELYGAWRILEGAVLCRDIDHNFGPLSTYWYALVFRVFGVGLGRFLWSNLAAWTVALFLLVRLVVQGWGTWTAAVAGLFFVFVHSFSNIVGLGNYTFLTPYAAEATYGFVVCLGVATALQDALTAYRPWKVLLAGLLTGAGVLLKPEPIAASLGMAAGAAALAWLRAPRERRSRQAPRVAALFLTGLALPILVATAGFRTASTSWGDAFAWANNAWFILVLRPEALSDPAALRAIGIDDVNRNLAAIAWWSGGAATLVAVTVAAARYLPRPALGSGAAVIGWVVFALAWDFDGWTDAGYALPVFVLAAAASEFATLRRSRTPTDAVSARCLLWLLACGYGARMGLFPRLYHYGFVQGAAAAAVSVGVLTYWAPRLASPERARRAWVAAVTTVVLAVCCFRFVERSESWRIQKTQAIGDGDDRFYALGPNIDPINLGVELLRQHLAADRSIRTFTVMPEGVLLNYLVRKPSSVPIMHYNPSQILQRARNRALFRASPPDAVVLVSRDMREHGVLRFGSQLRHGGELLQFVEQNYVSKLRLGGDPLDPNQRGVMLLVRRQTGDVTPTRLGANDVPK